MLADPGAAVGIPSIPRLFGFAGGQSGSWLVDSMVCVAGEPMTSVSRLSIMSPCAAQLPDGASWLLRGITSNERYVVREEKTALVGKQENLGRKASTRAALIPIRKKAAWWALPQDERREIFEARSHHIAIGMEVPSGSRKAVASLPGYRP